ncbi:MAG: hypothetical protein WCP21_00440 [Armatimonadota bacterium]
MGSRMTIFMATAALLGALSSGHAQSVVSAGLAQSLQQDLQEAQNALATGQSPWADARARPQAEPIRALSAELPGHRLWLAFKPVDAAIREAYRRQRMMWADKDAGIIYRRRARVGLEKLVEALEAEDADYPSSLESLAHGQIGEIDNALRHDEYHAALCILWSMADALGLWDRQAALETAADNMAALRAAGLRRKSLSRGQAEAFRKRLTCLGGMIERAVAWKPVNVLTPGQMVPLNAPDSDHNKHWAKEAFEPGGAFAVWRNDHGQSGASSWVLNQPIFRSALEDPPRNTKDLAPCLSRLRDWQYTLHEYRYGWVVYTRAASGNHWRPHGDWRDLEPKTFWPGAGGSQTAGGL